MTRTYGGWRRRRGLEVMGLPGPLLLGLLAAVCVPLVIGIFDAHAGLVAFVPGAFLAVAMLARSDGSPLIVALARRQIWHRAFRRGLTSYRSELVSQLQGPHYLPGPLAPIEMLAVRQVNGQLAAWLWDRRGGALTAQTRLTSAGTLLVDQSTVDAWVDGYGAWQASLGYTTGVRSVAIVVETAPSAGSRIRDYVQETVVDHAPPVALRLMDEVLDELPGHTTEVNQWVAVTIDPSKLPTSPKTLVEAVADASVMLTGVTEGLRSGGVNILERATPSWTAARVRAAFDPAARGQVEREQAGEAVLRWEQAGPNAATEHWDYLRHDAGWSVTYALRELPATRVRHDVLRRLMAPGRWPRRVAVLYRPYLAETAASVVDAELTAASTRRAAARKARREPRVRDEVDSARATSTAVEQARGAGMGEPGILVTVTVTDQADLATACADVENRARGARLKLVRLYGAQLLGFSATLGVGVDPYELAARFPGRGK